MNRSSFVSLVAAVAVSLLLLPAQKAAAEVSIVPQPREISLKSGKAAISANPKLYIDKKARISAAYAARQFGEMGITPVMVKKASEADIAIKMGKATGHKEGYTLEVGSSPAVSATADDRNGALYAIETIRQLLKPEGNGFAADACAITDWPEFGWRDFMLDEARHFQGMEMVKRLVDEMVRMKMNTFHWHLVDDQGWRLEIKGYPKLTSEGSLSDYDHFLLGAEKWKEAYPGRKRSYYTQTEAKEIVRYCAERGIRVIPEIEVPGHCTVATVVYPELQTPSDNNDDPAIYNVISPAFQKFITTTLTQVIKIFPSKIVHIGGDEAKYDRWSKSPEYKKFMQEHGLQTYADMQLYAINNIQKFLDKKGVKMIGWNEITGDNVHGEDNHGEATAVSLEPGTYVQFWDGSSELAMKAIKKGFNLVNSDSRYTYLCWDIPLDRAYNFNPYFEGLTPEQNSKVLGMGCQIWGEFTPDAPRLYYWVFPRFAAHGEGGWTKPANKNYADFIRRVAPIERLWLKKGFFTGQKSYSLGEYQPAK